MEYLSQYEYTITYINGDRNTVADALSRLLDTVEAQPGVVDVASVFSIESDPKLIRRMKKGYHIDSWCKGVLQDLKVGVLNVKLDIALKDGLLFMGRRLIISWYKHLHEHLFQLAHDNLGHFGMSKSYASLRDDFYWLNMRKKLMEGYIPSCPECQ